MNKKNNTPCVPVSLLDLLRCFESLDLASPWPKERVSEVSTITV